MSPSDRRGGLYRWRWPIALSALTIAVALIGWLGPGGPQILVYPTTDFTRLPVSAANPVPAAPSSCVSLREANGSAQLVDETCGTPASTYRVISRVAAESQCVHDADLTLSWSAGGKSGATCLDYDWVAGQCLLIGGQSVSKVDCTRRGAVEPQMTIIGAVDVSYCREGGIAHRTRHFTVCTLAGDKDCKGKPRAA
jgi:hypothetical protein